MAAKARILVVDDERDMLALCADTLSSLPGVEVLAEEDSMRAAERLRAEEVDMLITDLRMPGLGGIGLLRLARASKRSVPALVLTGYPEVESAVESMKLGAADYLRKPFNPAELRGAARDLLRGSVRSSAEGAPGVAEGEPREAQFEGILAHSSSMRLVVETIKRVAPIDADVLIVGETGTGKEMVARAIHRRSARREGPFVAVNGSAIPAELMESELFGHERGAFTGAGARTTGLLELAQKGSFFLDELHQLPLPLQAKLLRVLQERRIRRVGGTTEIALDVRIISASAVDLRELVRKGLFREDLYYRVDVLRIDLPPLRDRPEDIPLLARHFSQEAAHRFGQPPVGFAPDAVEALTRYKWPGNVRELQHLVERLMAMRAGETLNVGDLPDHVLLGVAGGSRPGGYLGIREARCRAFEREYLRDLLCRHRGDISVAAREARLSRWSLYRLLNRHGLAPEQFRHAPDPD